MEGAKLHCFEVRLENGSFWTRHFARNGGPNSYGERESVSSAIKAEEQCRS
jgi:hypothetical protein